MCAVFPMLCCINIALTENESTTGHVRRMIDQYKFIEEKDYCINHPRMDGQKNEYLFHPTAFKKCLIRSLKTEKYTNYYLILEKCVKYYNQYQLMIKDDVIKVINTIRLLQLKHSSTLDRFVIFKDNMYDEFPYGTIKGSNKNIKETMNDLNLNETNIILDLKVPSQSNFNKKVQEIMK